MFNAPSDSPGPNTALLSGKAAVTVEAALPGTLISVNGVMKGAAPVSIEVDLDNLGDVAVELDVTASFSDSMGGSKVQSTDPVSYRIARGERPPSVVRFDTEGATAH